MNQLKFYVRLKRKRRCFLNMYTFLGLLTTDGTITYILDTNQRLVDPRIILSARSGRKDVLLKLKTFLYQSFGIKSNLSESNDQVTNRADNLVISRIENVSRFIEAVKQTGSINGKPVL